MKKNLTNLLQSLSLYGKKSAPGFTVLEFLIVLAIMLILIAIALPGLQQSRVKAEDEKRITDLRTITLGLEQYKQLCEQYPATLDPGQSPSDPTLNP
jgi:prepilin-type N-terminal cleavage/methylation domain-containing protein